ncbi:GNAT family N-acetyltransferase [Amycolatopsis sp. K13G38]|uniref:GNAT family N-acetyltransferase n=1 Tax=Amycolatopsis acididurans TaxID=2724524 RepID=A0ABX1IXF7_9PSEU|nr:GNAT family N-acetyltransferase [Amycolatopsis acididurans]NKQ52191.1 GNAT family N-acetyltransferase [Amycolatopsis acididurans]
MGEFTIRPLTDAEQRPAFDVLGRALHFTGADEAREQFANSVTADRRFGAFDGERVIGTAGSFGTELCVPGGKMVPAAAVDGVGVRADHTRRGVATALMCEQLRDCARRGEMLAHLHASEAMIYGHFGYGAATRGLTLRIGQSAFRPDAPEGGRVRILDPGEARAELPALYARIGPHRPGMMTRPEHWWITGSGRHSFTGHTVAVHDDDGFVVYRPLEPAPGRPPHEGAVLAVRDLHAADVRALAGLWRFVLGIDLVAEVWTRHRPVDEPVGAMLVDPRAAQVSGMSDEIWLRLIDVAEALSARTYGDGDPVVVEITDTILPGNSGRYRISPEGAQRTALPAALRLTPDVLAMLYLGDARPSTLAALGRIEVTDPAALPAADRLLSTAVPPWCGTSF